MSLFGQGQSTTGGSGSFFGGTPQASVPQPQGGFGLFNQNQPQSIMPQASQPSSFWAQPSQPNAGLMGEQKPQGISGGLFGTGFGQQTQPPQTIGGGTGLFGQSGQAPSMFGQAKPQTGPSLFGNVASPTPQLFGSTTQQQQQTTTSPFGTQQQPTSASPVSLFGGQQSSSLMGSSTPSFGTANWGTSPTPTGLSFGQSNLQKPNQGLFSQPSAPQGSGSIMGGSPFPSATGMTQQGGVSLFGGASTPVPQNINQYYELLSQQIQRNQHQPTQISLPLHKPNQNYAQCIIFMNQYKNVSRDELRALDYKSIKAGILQVPQQSSVPFMASTGPSLFGGVNKPPQTNTLSTTPALPWPAQPQQSTSLFGGALQMPQPVAASPSLNQPQQGGLFGQANPITTAAPQPGPLFGAMLQPGLAQANQPQQQTKSLFGNLFGNQSTGTPSTVAPPQQSGTPSLFNWPTNYNQQQQQPTTSNDLWQSNPPQQGAAQSLFQPTNTGLPPANQQAATFQTAVPEQPKGIFNQAKSLIDWTSYKRKYSQKFGLNTNRGSFDLQNTQQKPNKVEKPVQPLGFISRKFNQNSYRKLQSIRTGAETDEMESPVRFMQIKNQQPITRSQEFVNIHKESRQEPNVITAVTTYPAHHTFRIHYKPRWTVQELKSRFLDILEDAIGEEISNFFTYPECIIKMDGQPPLLIPGDVTLGELKEEGQLAGNCYFELINSTEQAAIPRNIYPQHQESKSQMQPDKEVAHRDLSLNDNYQCTPDLYNLSENQLQKVENFCIWNEFGTITYLDPIDFTHVRCLRDCIQIEQDCVQVSDSGVDHQHQGQEKPLNKPAIIIFRNFGAGSFKDRSPEKVEQLQQQVNIWLKKNKMKKINDYDVIKESDLVVQVDGF